MIVIEDTRQKAGKHDVKHKCFADLKVDLVRCKLPFGDYAPGPPISIDTKENMDEIAGNICGSGHKRFIAECKAAQAADCKLYILVENELGISDISQVHTWENPRSVFSPNCPQGPRLQKAMETISERYGATFLFCRPEESAEIIWELISNHGEQVT